MLLNQTFTDEQLIESARKDNPIAMYQLALRYDSELLQDSNDELYIFWLSKFLNCDVVENIIKSFDDDSTPSQILLDGQEVLYELIVDTGIRLGLFFKNSTNISELKLAYDGLYAAYIVSRFAYIEIEKGLDLQSLLLIINQRIEYLSTNCFTSQSVNNSILDSVPNYIRQKFQPTTCIEIKTHEMCMQLLDNQSPNIDYSSAIIPIMKCLEHELKIHLYIPYINYLKSNISPQDYFREIQSNCSGITNQKQIIKSRKKILYGNSLKDCCYTQKPETQNLTIGEFRCSIGANSFVKTSHVDSFFVGFCNNVIFADLNVDNIKIKGWIHHLIESLESLREIRNKSAHGGVLQNREDANSVIDELFIKEKSLLQIVSPSLLWK